MFADIEADVYVLVDGDDTYEAFAAPAMIGMLIDERLDLVSGRARRRAPPPIAEAMCWATGSSPASPR